MRVLKVVGAVAVLAGAMGAWLAHEPAQASWASVSPAEAEGIVGGDGAFGQCSIWTFVRCDAGVEGAPGCVSTFCHKPIQDGPSKNTDFISCLGSVNVYCGGRATTFADCFGG